MKKTIYVFVMVALTGLALTACQPPEKAATEQPMTEATKTDGDKAAEPGEHPDSMPKDVAALEAGKTGHYGAPFTVATSEPLAAVLDKADTHVDKTVKVRGEVASVCKKKGCWFVIKTDEDKSRTVRITMKDYGFFVPKDCDGKVAEVEGVLTKKVVKEAVRKHLAEDGGEDPSKVVGDSEELQLVATGVGIQG